MRASCNETDSWISILEEEAFEFVLDSFERKCDLSKASLTSNCRLSDVVETRRVFYRILKDFFNLTSVGIGRLFNKDHSTIISSMIKHSNLYGRDRAYTELFNSIKEDVEYRISIKTKKENDRIRLRMVQTNECESHDIIMASFDSQSQATEHILMHDIRHDMMIFRGSRMHVPDDIAKEVVLEDGRRSINAIIERNKVQTIHTREIDRYYKNYNSGSFSIRNNASESLLTAMQ